MKKKYSNLFKLILSGLILSSPGYETLAQTTPTPQTMEFGSVTNILADETSPNVDASSNILLNGFDVSAISSSNIFIAFAIEGNSAGTDAHGGASDAVLGWFGNATTSISSASLSTNSENEISINSATFAYEQALGGAALDFTITAIRDTNPVGTLVLTNPPHNTSINLDFSSPTTGSFSSIDEIVITPANPIFGGFSIDELEVGAVGASNNLPIVTSPSPPTVLEDAVNVNLADNIQISDADNDDQTVSFVITGGTLNLGAAGITFGGNGNGSASFTAQGTLANINAALDAATFTPSADLNGINAGGISFTSNDGTDNSAPVSVNFNITGVNDEPSFTAGADETINEDAGTQTVNGWATSLNTGATNESAQTLSFTVTNNNNTLFSAQPAIDANGNLTYIPADDASGTATVSVVLTDNGGTSNGGDDTFATQQFTITVNSVNDEPSFTTGADETVNEDAGAQTVNAWATGLNTGATNESAQTLSFAVTNDNNTLFSVQPAVDASGNLTYTPADDASGTATVSVVLSDDGGTANGGDDTFATQTLDITVNPVNDEPSFTAGADETVNEDAGTQTISVWATSINTGATNESAQTLSFTVTNDNNALFSTQPAIDASGNLTYTPAADASGTATVSVVLTDNGGTANGGDDTFATQMFDITVNPVNDEPSFTAGANETINEDAGAQTENGWATSINAGATNENAQTLSFAVTNDNNALFSTQPTIDASGNLTYTPAADASGSATVSVVLTDNGGTANGGDDTFATQTFDITVNPVNDEPSFTVGADETINEDAGAQTKNGWATSINAGATNENAQTLSFAVTNDNNALFSTQPAIDASGNLTYTPAADASGSATVSVVLMDNGGTANGGDDTFATQTFDITVNPVNDEPSFTAGADETINEDAGAQTENGWATSINAGATNENAQTLSFAVTNDNNALFSTQPAIDVSGNLTYTPAADASGTATVSVVLTDNGGTANGGDATFATQQFTITVNAVNDAPSFTPGANQTVNEDTGAQTVNGWATNLDAGAADEIGQTLEFTVENNNGTLFSVQPAIDANGNLSFTPAEGQVGTAVVSVTLQDDGGTANGGVDTFDGVEFRITIDEVLSTEEVFAQSDFSFVNPVASTFTVNSNLEINSIVIFNMSGSQVTASNSKSINVERLASGMYIAFVRTTNGVLKTFKIIKE